MRQSDFMGSEEWGLRLLGSIPEVKRKSVQVLYGAGELQVRNAQSSLHSPG